MKRILSFLAAVCMCFTVVAAAPASDLPADGSDPAGVSEPVEATISVQLPTSPLTTEEKSALLSALYEADITALREAISLGLISCQELTEFYLERIQTYNEPYNCFITLCDNAVDITRQRDQQLANGEADGRLFGIPVVVKDNVHYAGYPTTNGRSGRLNVISDENAQIVEYLLAEGAVIIGKTNMSTDAQDARVSRSSAAGETKNAYNIYLASGGSSGGSAVATSLNFAAAAIGTDTNSSLRYPAALNGCVSLRPTHGLLSREGCIPLNSRRDTPGAITRSVLDQAIMLDVISGGEQQYTENLDSTVLSGMRIGVLKEFAYASNAYHRSASHLDPEIVAAFENAVQELKSLGAEIVDVSLPRLFTLSANTFEDDSRTNREKFYTAFQEMLETNNVSAVIFPTYLSAPQWSGKDAEGVNHSVHDQPYITNCRGLSPCIGIPEISVPIGHHSRGAGIGMEIASLHNAEQLLLNIAYAYTEHYDHRAAPSGAQDLYADSHLGTLSERIEAYRESLKPKPVEPPSDEPTRIPAEPETAVVTEEPPAENTPPEYLLAGCLLGMSLVAGLLFLVLRRKGQKQLATQDK